MSVALETLPSDVESLRALLLEERAKRELAEQASQIAKNRIAHLEELLRSLQRKSFGPSSEQWNGQPCLFNECEAEVEEAENLRRRVGAHERSIPKRRPLPPDLPRKDVIHELSGDELICSCGGHLTAFGEETSEQLAVIPAKLEVVRHRRLKYSCSGCKSCVKTAPMPPQALPKTNASPELLAYVATAKYVDGLPLHRQEEIFRRLGIDMPRSTLSRWMIALAELLRPLYNLMQDDLLEASVLLMDETPVQVLKGTGKKATSPNFMWVRCRAGPGPKIILFTYDPGRGAHVAKDLLSGFAGYLVTDGYEVYASVAGSRDGITHCGCWDHARRRFHDAVKAQADTVEPTIAAIGLSYIQALYRVERDVKDDDTRRRRIVRDLYSRSILEHMRRWLDRVKGTVPPKSLTGKALGYLHNEWDRLVRFLHDGEIPISNQTAENAIRPFAVGRRNWLFSATRAGAEASSILYSIVESAKANGREPYAYFSEVIARLPACTTVEELTGLLPYRSKA
jgi:transposase